jgi:hypothetical protein
MGDEILLRWRKERTGLFERAREWHAAPGKNAAKIRQQAKHPVFAKGDLHVFDHCAAEVFKRPLFKEGAVATQVVYMAVLGHDLLEQQDRIKVRASDSAVSDKELNDEWRRFRELLDELDAAAGQLYRRISQRYDEYVKAGGFGKAAAVDKKDLLTRMNEARRRRLGDDRDPPPPSS